MPYNAYADTYYGYGTPARQLADDTDRNDDGENGHAAPKEAPKTAMEKAVKKTMRRARKFGRLLRHRLERSG